MKDAALSLIDEGLSWAFTSDLAKKQHISFDGD